MLLVKSYLLKWIIDIDVSKEDQIWAQFRWPLKCLLGFGYIPPPDSEYYSHDSFAAIQ